MENENTNTEDANKKSKKGLYIIIGLVVIAVIALATSSKPRGMTPGGDIKKNIDGSTTFSNKEGNVTVGSGKLPDNWPSDVPKYANADIQYTGTSNPQTGQEGTAVVFFTTDKIANVADFYKKQLPSSGWTIEQTGTFGANTIISAKKDTRTFGISIVDAGDGKVSVTLAISNSK